MTEILNFSNIVDSLENGLIILNDELNVIYANQWVYDHYHKDKESILNKPIIEAFNEVEGSRIPLACHDALDSGLPSILTTTFNKNSFNFCKHTNDENKKNIKQLICIRPHSIGTSQNFCEIHITDMTENFEREEVLKLSENRFRSLAKIAPVGIFQTDITGKLTYHNEMWASLTGNPNEEDNYWFSRIIDTEKELVVRRWIEERDKLPCCSYECQFTCEDKILWGLLKILEEKNIKGELLGYVGTLTDITEQREYQSNIEQLSYYDSLTNLANRQLLRDRVERGLKRTLSNDNKLAILHIDVDNFKRINDSVGHDTGDRIIACVAERITECVGEQGTVARLGGDEFCICMSNLDNANQAAKIANQIVETITLPMDVKGNDVIITCSVGIAIAPDDADDYESLMNRAELAMYSVKEKGRNNFQFFSPFMNNRASERLALESDLRNALQDDQFYLCYQPKFDIKTERIFGVEALVRWKHPERGEIRPDEFISVAEQMGQIIELGKYVMQKSCSDLKILRSKKLVDDDFCVSVNLSVKQFQTLSLLHTVITSLFDSSIPGHCLDLEITESIIMENLSQSIEMLNCMKNYGITISIDDFGTGYSSLGYLKQLPVNTVKIDRSFVRDIPEDSGNTSIVGAIVAMSHKLDLNVVAEGIETQEQLETLKELGCDQGQGYLISKPIVLDELEQLLLKQNNTHLLPAGDQGSISHSQKQH